MTSSILERGLSWYHHPWGWLVLFAILLLLFIGWMATPLTWHNAEGNGIREGQNTANFWDSVFRVLWWR